MLYIYTIYYYLFNYRLIYDQNNDFALFRFNCDNLPHIVRQHC